MPDVTIAGTNTTISFPDSMSAADIQKALANNPQIKGLQGTAPATKQKGMSTAPLMGNLPTPNGSPPAPSVTPSSAQSPPDLSGATSGAVSGGAQGEPDAVYEPPANPGTMGAVGAYRNPVTGQRVSPTGYNPDPVQKFRDDYFNTLNEKANIPMQAAVALSKNPKDPDWTARVAKMSLVAQTAIQQKAQEIATAPVYDSTPSGTLGTFGQAPIYRDPQTNERTAIPQPHDIIGTMLHGPEGYKQLQEAHGAIPELIRMAEGSLDPENLAFIAAAGAIGAAGKAGQVAVKAGIGTLMGANAVSKVKQGDYGGAAVDAALGLLPLADHPVSDAVGKANNKAQMRANLSPGTPSYIPEIFRAPVVDPTQARAVIDPNAGIITPKPGVDLQPHEQAAIDTHNANVRAQRAQGEPNVPTGDTATATGDRGTGVHSASGIPDGAGLPARGTSGSEDVPTPSEISIGGGASEPRPTAPSGVPGEARTAEPTGGNVNRVAANGETAAGIRAANEETEARRAEKGLPELPGYTAKTSEEVYQEVKDRGQSADALNVADDVIKNKRAMTAYEIAANVLRQNEIEAQQDTLYKQITEAAKAGRPYEALQADYDALDQHYQKLTDATKYSGAEQSLAFRIRDYEINRYGRQQVLKRLTLSNPEVPLSAADKDLVQNLTSEHNTLQEGLDKANAAVEAQHAAADETDSQKAATEAIKPLMTKEQRVKGDKWVLNEQQRAKLDAEYKDIQDRFLRKTTGQANALVDPSVLPIIRDLAKNRVQYGFTKVADLVDEVHRTVEPGIPGITKREVRDAISGHGYGSKIPVGSALSDLKKQMRLMSDIENIRDKVPAPTRTRRPVSPEEAALRKEKADLLAENRPPRKQMTAERQLEGYKKQLSANIDDLTRRIAEKDFTANGRSKLLLDPEAEQLKAQRDSLQKVYDSLDPAKQKAPASPKAQKAAQARFERLEKQFNDMKAANSKGEYGKPDAPARPDTPEEAAMRANLEAARRESDSMRAATSEGTPADPLRAYKNRLATQIADMQTSLDRNLEDRASGGKTKQLDAEAKVLRDQRDQMREAVNRKRAEIDRIIEARKGKSFLDKYAIYHRAAILSRISTLGKLASAAAQRALFTPIEEGAGVALRAVPGYGKIAAKAPHGTPSLAAEGAALRSLADVKGNTADAKLKFRTGMNSLDARLGAQGAEADAEPVNLFTAGQNAHGAIKTPIQRAAFERSMVQQERYELRQGHDINDPAVRTVMEARAYMKSKEAILMQDNALSTAWHGMVKGLEQNPRLGKFGKNSAAALRAAMPIVKVPSNFVGEVASHTPLVGLVRPAYELAISKGIEGLSPEQADIIVTALKKHAVGTALFALGYWQADKMGGFYHKDGNGMNDVKPNEIRINLFGKEMDVPSTFLHSPQMEVMMMGAAFRQAIEQAQNSRSRTEVSPTAEALHRTATGVADALPFVDTPKRLLQAMEGPDQAGKAAGDTLGSALVPGFLPDIANQIDRDPDSHFQVRKRPVKGFGDALKASVGARVLVPEDSGRRR